MALPRKTRGEWRPVYESIVTHPEFIAFSPEAKLVFYTLKLSCGGPGIKAWPGMESALAEMTGHTVIKVRSALNELTRGNWIMRDGPVVWVIEGLENEPQLSHGEKHQAYVAKAIAGLSSGTILKAFRKRYAAFLTKHPHEDDDVSDTLSLTLSDSVSVTTKPIPIQIPTLPLNQLQITAHERCRLLVTVAANSGITKNPQFGQQPMPIRASASSTSKFADAIVEANVDVDFAAAVVFAYATECVPTDGKAPKSLGYFTQHVLNRWEACAAYRAAAQFSPTPGAIPGAPNETNVFNLHAIRDAQAGNLEYQKFCDDHHLVWRAAS